MSPVTVRLTWSEVTTAAITGVRRHAQNLGHGRKDRHGASPKDGWQLHVEGACGEMAAAKALDRFWSGCLDDLDAGDVGLRQVRTATTAGARLILHPSDSDDAIFILVIIGEPPTYQVVGWITARDGKRPEFWQDPTGRSRWAFFVPQSELRPMSELMDQ